jgi:coenzyme F420 hydrogenase subunit delta
MPLLLSLDVNEGENPDDETIPDYVKARVLVLGCGNLLFGDDGFGPELARYYPDHFDLPGDVVVRDAHTAVKKLLFNILLSEVAPELIVIVDAVDKGKDPGEVFEIELEDIPLVKKDDFSMHQMPTSDLLAEIKNLGKVDIRILVCQVKEIPPEVRPGLSEEVERAIPKACEIIDKWISKT